MNEKLYKEEFRNILKREYGMSEREAADALNKFFSLVIKALEEEKDSTSDKRLPRES